MPPSGWSRLRPPATVRRGRSRSLWYRNVSALLTKSGAPVWGADVLRRSEPVLSSSEGHAAFARGLGLEIVACQVDAGVPPSGFGMRLSTPLHAAAGFYEEALRRDGSLHEAALHLGRTRLMLGDLADARRWLEAATQSPLAGDRYLAFLYLGSMEELDGRFDQAEARYRAAMSTFAWGQSGPLATRPPPQPDESRGRVARRDETDARAARSQGRSALDLPHESRQRARGPSST